MTPTTFTVHRTDPPVGSLRRIAGHKGYGLGFMIELFAGALTASSCRQAAKTGLEQRTLSFFIDPSQLSEDGFFGSDAARRGDFVKSAKTAKEGAKS